MVELLLKRYLWLIDTLKRNGKMTFEEISDKWNRRLSMTTAQH